MTLRQLTVVLVAHCMVLLAPTPGQAMTCIARSESLDQALESADIVFIGRLVQAAFTHRRTVVHGTFAVNHVIKGTHDLDLVDFETMNFETTGCGLDVELDAEYVVFATLSNTSILVSPDTVAIDSSEAVKSWVSRMLEKQRTQSKTRR